MCVNFMKSDGVVPLDLKCNGVVPPGLKSNGLYVLVEWFSPNIYIFFFFFFLIENYIIH